MLNLHRPAWPGAVARLFRRTGSAAPGLPLRRRGFLRSNAGVAAVEFAFLAPVLILLYVGAGELSQAVMSNRRMESLSRALVDLVSQQPTSSQTSSTPAPANATTQTALQTIFTASQAIMAPSPLSTLTMTVSAIDITNNSAGLCCNYKVRWSYTQAGTLRPCNVNLTPVDPTQAPSATTISNAMVPPVLALTSPIAVLVSDVSYTYTAPFASTYISFPTAMKRTSYMLPRIPGQVILSSPITASGTQSGAICY